jgi:hypothetical protein
MSDDIPILRGLPLRQAKQRLLSSLLRRPSLFPNVERNGISRDHFRNHPEWQQAFELVRSGADIPSLVAGIPTSEIAHLWRLGVELSASAMLSLARQVVASVRAEDAAAEVAATSPTRKVIQPKEGHQANSDIADVSFNERTSDPALVTAAEAITARVGAVDPNGPACGDTARQPKLVLPTTERSPRVAAKLVEAMSFLRHELQGEVAATEIERRAQKAGIALKTLKRARAKLGIVSRRHGFGAAGKFYLSLPGDHSGPTGA